MHECSLKILVCRLLILLCAKSSQTFITNKSLNRIKPKNNDIDPQIEFKIIDKQRVSNIRLHDHTFSIHKFLWHVFDTFENLNSITLSARLWLAYPN